jgi:hypothetical protein
MSWENCTSKSWQVICISNTLRTKHYICTVAGHVGSKTGVPSRCVQQINHKGHLDNDLGKNPINFRGSEWHPQFDSDLFCLCMTLYQTPAGIRACSMPHRKEISHFLPFGVITK